MTQHQWQVVKIGYEYHICDRLYDKFYQKVSETMIFEEKIVE